MKPALAAEIDRLLAEIRILRARIAELENAARQGASNEAGQVSKPAPAVVAYELTKERR